MAPMEVHVVVVGSTNVDLVASVARLPQPGETVPALSYDEFLGGKGSNQAIAAARLGRHVSFVGLVGDDREGAVVRAALRAETIDDAHLGTQAQVPTGRAIVLVDDAAENAIVVVGGANQSVTPAHVERASDVLRAASVVVAQLEIPVEAVTAAARAAAGTFVLNPAPARALPADLLDRVDVLVVNETEYEVVTGHPLPEEPAALGDQLRGLGLRCAVVVTLGARGALVWEGADVVHVPARLVPVVDTTGAGDTFIGALADALSRGEPPVAAARWAAHAASFAVGSLGATTGMPTRADVLAAMERSGDGAVPTQGARRAAPDRPGADEEAHTTRE